MTERQISLTDTEMKLVVISLGTAIAAREELVRKCIAATESGLLTEESQHDYVKLAEKAKQEIAVYQELRGRMLNEMYGETL